MGRHTQIHETTRYEVIVRGVESRAEAEAIVSAVAALPAPSAWIPPAPELPPAVEEIAYRDADDSAPQMMDEAEARAK